MATDRPETFPASFNPPRDMAPARASVRPQQGARGEDSLIVLHATDPGQVCRRVALTTEGADGTVLADADQVRQVLLNLLTNALAACAEGGRVAVRVSTADDAGRIEVEDDGGGMSAEAARRAFEPLFTTREGGAGLGLPVVRSIVEEHGGTVTFQTSSRGTTFRVDLPSRGTA